MPTTGVYAFEEIDEADAIELRALVAEHEQRTGSTVAARLLADWDVSLGRFVKVMPDDYRRVLDEVLVDAASRRHSAPALGSVA